MSDFGKISLKQILVLIEILNNSSLFNADVIEESFSRRSNGYNDIVSLFESIGLIKINNNKIHLTAQYNPLKECHSSQNELVCATVVKCLLKHRMSHLKNFYEFISHFIKVEGVYEFVPSAFHRIHYSNARNFLIDLGMLRLSNDSRKYMISDNYSSEIDEYFEKQKLSIKNFNRMLSQQQEIGDMAEFQIIEYEKQRLAQYPNLVERIKHTSQCDVGAGYDIQSFDVNNDQYVPRYIEVKAVSLTNYQFIFSRNEMEKSELYRDRYYLYLLPVKNDTEFHIEKLMIINNPYSNILDNEECWQKLVETISFSLLTTP